MKNLIINFTSILLFSAFLGAMQEGENNQTQAQTPDLFDVLDQNNEGRLLEADVRAIGLTVLDIIENMSNENQFYHGIRPENLIFNFGSHQLTYRTGNGDPITNLTPANNLMIQESFGAAEYLAPEQVREQPYGAETMLWKFGVLMYELLVGFPPFDNDDIDMLRQEIELDNPLYPTQMSDEAQDLISSLLMKDINERLTDIEAIRNHAFFTNAHEA